MDFWASLWDFVGFFFWTMVLVSYLYVLFAVITDVFRDREMSGCGKAGWLILMLFVLDSGTISVGEFEAIKSRALGGAQAGRVTD
ncbi:hypothetical protein E3T54_16025 [Cryobacterium sp. Sr8]|nr:hypothetical protein [Cryobacterium sp. Sr8]TFD74338.1 hypothetical protein E3T54_16025 [Cryobacterium sp. Sr8]